MKRAVVQIWGGHGDAMWASSILRRLKQDGHRVMLVASPFAGEVLRHDPHIDELIVQPTPLQRLDGGDVFEVVLDFSSPRETFRHILPRSTDPLYAAPLEERQRRLAGVNYVEHLHQLAGYPDGPFEPRFYPTPEERARAIERKGDGSALVIAVAGGWQHKRWPWIGSLVSLVLARTSARIYLVGSKGDRAHLQSALSVDPLVAPSDRVVNLCGEPIRDAYALAQIADAVVGPETGLLNAVAMEPNRKVVLLSHSSAYNLCRDWENTVAIAADVPCHPCHRLHDRGTRDCPRDPSGAWAACAASIRPARVFAAVRDVLPAGGEDLASSPSILEAA